MFHSVGYLVNLVSAFPPMDLCNVNTAALSETSKDHQLSPAPPTFVYPGKVLAFFLVNLKLPLASNPFSCLSDLEGQLLVLVYENLVLTDTPNFTWLQTVMNCLLHPLSLVVQL